MEDPTGFVIDDQLAYGPLREVGWDVEAVPWTRPAVTWSAYDAVVIRSPWDYTSQPAKFLDVLAEIERTGVPLLNDLNLVRWNLDKRYLCELAKSGVPIVPTVWRDRLTAGELLPLFDAVGAREMVVKPVVGAGASGAFRLDRAQLSAARIAEVEAYYVDRALMAQPFLHAIVTEGEYSLFYFNGELSHVILKVPKEGDFRVQEEHGSEIRAVRADVELRRAAERAMQALGTPPLYARVDLVQSQGGDGFWLMELELIEPALYFRMDADSPQRFAMALDRRVRERRT
jgi:glutathione synthase/RimK-type ligase-like ATP-grasp enzyme